MNIGDWIQVVSVLIVLAGVIVSLIIGTSSIRQTHQIQFRQERHQLLDRIEQWAVELGESGIEPDTSRLTNDVDANRSWPFLEKELPKLVQLQILRARSVAIFEISKRIDSHLGNTIGKAIDSLREQLRLLHEYKNFEEKRDIDGTERTTFLATTAKAISQNHALIYEAAVSVIEAVTAIRPIGSSSGRDPRKAD